MPLDISALRTRLSEEPDALDNEELTALHLDAEEALYELQTLVDAIKGILATVERLKGTA